MLAKISHRQHCVDRQQSQALNGLASATARGAPTAHASAERSAPSQLPEASVSKPGKRSGNFRPRHLSPPKAPAQAPQTVAQTTTFEELAAFNGNAGDFGFMPSLAETVSFAQAAEKWLLTSNSSEPMFASPSQAFGEVARYIQTHAGIADDPSAGIEDQMESKRKVDDGMQALRCALRLYTPAKVSDIHNEVRRAVDQQRSPAEGVADVAVRAFESLPAFVDEEVRVAAGFTAAAAILVANSFALSYGISTHEDIAQALKDEVKRYPKAQVVLDVWAASTQDSSEG